ncbi:MAG: LacI family DNA-binding transcriptional regulator [Faecalibacterium sp.]
MTIKDIARLSGCSISTISRVINNRPDVNPETKEKVLRIMKEVGFTPNNNARQLKIQQSRNIVFAVKGTRNLFLAELLVLLQAYTEEYGYNGVISYLDENATDFDSVERIVRELKPKGIIFLGGNVDHFADIFAGVGIPSVLATVTSDRLTFENLSMVGVDDSKASALAIEYLLANGHKKIAIMGGPVSSFTSKTRLAGAKQAMARHGLTFDEDLYSLSNYDFESAYNAMNAMLAKRKKFTALFAMSDSIAIGAMRALVSAGYKVPEDVSVMGFDGMALSRFTIPVLTTVKQPAERICKKSVSLLVDQIERHKKGETLVLDATILEGESVRRI